MKRDGSRLLHVILDDGGDQVPFEVGHRDGVGASVGPRNYFNNLNNYNSFNLRTYCNF
jgi:hypothetical protein